MPVSIRTALVKSSIQRTLVAGVFAGVVFNMSLFVTFRVIGFGMDGKGILMSPSQSEKLKYVWTTKPVPRVIDMESIDGLPVIGAGLVLFAIAHAFFYRSISPAWPRGIAPRALRLAFWLWLVVFVFWEFFTPFNQLHEPLPLLGLEIIFWAVIALAESFTIAAIMEKRPEQPADAPAA
jgi:hypothetical protein